MGIFGTILVFIGFFIGFKANGDFDQLATSGIFFALGFICWFAARKG